MKKQTGIPVSYWIGVVVIAISVIVNVSNRWFFNPPQEWLSWVYAGLSVVGAVIMIYSAIKLTKSRNRE